MLSTLQSNTSSSATSSSSSAPTHQHLGGGDNSSLSSFTNSFALPMDGRDSQQNTFAPYSGAASSQTHAMGYDNQDPNQAAAAVAAVARQHYAPTQQYDSNDVSRQYQTAPSYLTGRPGVYPDPRYAAVDHSRVQPTANGYDPTVALAGAYQYPPASGGGWRAEWYPPVSSAFPPHAGGHVSAAPPMGVIGSAVPRPGDSRMRRGRAGEFTGNTVYSFVPLPGAAQQKRPRRRYEEIERIYKCGWQGCEKAYGTLNHLNAHVTMQNHGPKRTPEEFKETRKEWKARKKEEENRRKAEAEARAAANAQQQSQQPQPQHLGGQPGNGTQNAQAQSGSAGANGSTGTIPLPMHIRDPQYYQDPYGQYP
ncbi:hypothetical protein V1511DRAFT_489629 [Dipodascopsis uninucleata]